MSRLSLYLLGPPRLERDGAPLKLDTRKAVALLAYVAITGKSHGRDTLACLLWPESDQSHARAALRRTLSALRKALDGDYLDIDRESVGLARGRDEHVWLDVDAFRSHLAACRGHGHPWNEVCPDCLAPLAEAAALYRDHLLAGFTLRDSPAFDDWQFFLSERLRDDLADALERLARIHDGREDFEPAIGCARRRLELDPLHEPAHRCLMRLYARAGRHAAAHRQYEECRRLLDEELGVEPQEETTDLHQAIQARRDLPPLGPPPSPQAARRLDLPLPATPFIGRKAMLADIAEKLHDPACRLLTLVGPGGSGKTRLAIETARAQAERFGDGAAFVPLDALRAGDEIAPAVAKALGLSLHAGMGPGGGAQVPAEQRVLDYLRGKELLLVLDNLEHLLEGVELLARVIETVPGVQLLATSRARLNVRGEHLYPIGGMDVPGEDDEDPAQYSAVALFLAGARRVQPGFDPRGDELAAVVRACQLVEGLPLGVVLAASWVGMLSPPEIAAQLAGEEGHPLDLLEADLRGAPERQRSMRVVFDHSWVLLTERQRAVMETLSVFRGGFTRAAAERVAGASLRDLRALVDRSLLHRAAAGRYEPHELLRQYAAERLAQDTDAEEAARDRHCAHYAAALEQWDADLKGPRQWAALAEMDRETENGWTAWDWALEREQFVRLRQIIEGMCHFCRRRGLFKPAKAACRGTAERLAGTASADGLRTLVISLTWKGLYLGSDWASEVELVREPLEQGLALLESPELAGVDVRAERARLLARLGRAAHHDPQESARLYEQSLALYRELGNHWGEAEAMREQGNVAMWMIGAYDQAREWHAESLAISRSLDDQWGILSSLWGMSLAAKVRGRLDEAESLERENLAHCREIGNRETIAQGLDHLGLTLHWHGKFSEAADAAEECIAVTARKGPLSGEPFPDSSLGFALAHLGRYEEARAQAQRSEALAKETNWRGGIGLALLLSGRVALAEGAHAKARQSHAECIAIFGELGLPHSLGESLVGLGYAARGLGQPAEAWRRLREGLRTVEGSWPFMVLLWSLPLAALLLADRGQGEGERAVELYALALRHPYVGNSRLFEDVAGRQIAAVAAALPPEAAEAARERGRARDLKETVAELLEEMEQDQ